MNIITKNTSIIINALLLIYLLNIYAQAEESGITTEIVETEDSALIDDEELPAMDPFLGGTTFGGQIEGQGQENDLGQHKGIMNNMKLIGTIKGEYKRLAILSSPDGRAFKYQERENITEDVVLTRIFNDLIVIRDQNGIEYEVHMNNRIKMIEE